MFEIRAIDTDGVSGFLHTPASPSGNGLVLTHGAGGNCQAPLLLAIAAVFTAAGNLVLRCDLPFRQSRRFGPPFPAQSAGDRAGLRSAISQMKQLASRRVFLGGHSYGGRQASILAAEDPQLFDGLLLLSYPLHPPNKPGQLRTAHFPSLQTPALFVHGTQDPFGSVEELTGALAGIPAATALSVMPGAGHDLGKGKLDWNLLAVAPFARLIGS